MSGRSPAVFTPARLTAVLLVGLCFAIGAILAGTLFGAESVSLFSVLDGSASQRERFILLELRLPRVLLAAVVGGWLALIGAVYQALLRNPLAEPYLLGISGGGAFGAVAAIVMLGDLLPNVPAVRGVAAFLGCMLALLAVYRLATRRRVLEPTTLLLAGVVANAFFLAGLACLQYLATPTEAQAILRWVMGGLGGQGVPELLLIGIATPPFAWLVLRHARSLDLLAFGEEGARHLGVNVERTRLELFLATSVMVALSVAVAGPIGFVGLFVPHAVRFVVGADHRVLLPVTFLAGMAFLALADAGARTALPQREVPVGIVTALIGAPAFVLVLLRLRRGEGGGARD